MIDAVALHLGALIGTMSFMHACMHEVAPSNVVSLLKFTLQNVEAYFTGIGGKKIGGSEVPCFAFLLQHVEA